MTISSIGGAGGAGGGGFANGIGAFKPSGETTSSNADNGHFNPGTNLNVLTPASFGIRFSGKTYGPGWGYASGSPIKVSNMFAASGQPGGSIVLRQQDDPEKVCIYRINAAPEIIQDFGLNDDTIFRDVEYLGATFTNFEETALYEVSVIPNASSCIVAGSGVFTMAGTTQFAKRWSWNDDADWTNTTWTSNAFASSSPDTVATYLNAGIMMPSAGGIVSFTMQVYLTNGTNIGYKPELLRVRGTPGTNSDTSVMLTNASYTGVPTATANQLSEFTCTPSGLNANQLSDTTFLKGDKLVVVLQELVNGGGSQNMRVEWSMRLALFDELLTGEAPGD